MNIKFVLTRPEVAVECATEGLKALERLDNSSSVLLWPADTTIIPGTDSNAIRFKLET